MVGSVKFAGFTVVEVIVAMALGLVLISALFQVTALAKRSFSQTYAVLEMVENATFAMDFIYRALAVAGYASIEDPSKVSGDGLAFRQLKFPSHKYFSAGAFISGQDSIHKAKIMPDSDLIRVRMYGMRDSGARDCRDDQLAIERVTIRTLFLDDEGILRCGNANLSNAAPLVEGLKDLQFLYGVALDATRPYQLSGYFNAAQVPFDSWARVLAIRVILHLKLDESTDWQLVRTIAVTLQRGETS